MTTLGERLLSAVLPQATAEADDYCHWETQCQNCSGYPIRRWSRTRSRLCCTSQDGSYCNPWGSWGSCKGGTCGG